MHIPVWREDLISEKDLLVPFEGTLGAPLQSWFGGMRQPTDEEAARREQYIRDFGLTPDEAHALELQNKAALAGAWVAIDPRSAQRGKLYRSPGIHHYDATAIRQDGNPEAEEVDRIVRFGALQAQGMIAELERLRVRQSPFGFEIKGDYPDAPVASTYATVNLEIINYAAGTGPQSELGALGIFSHFRASDVEVIDAEKDGWELVEVFDA